MEQGDAPAVTPQRLMQLGWSYAPALIVESAVANGIFDALAEAPRSIAETAAATGASARGLRAIMDALVGLELLAKSGADRYALTPESAAFLVASSPAYLGGFFRHLSRQLVPNWLQLTEVVRTGRPAAAVNDEQVGGAFFAEFVEALYPINRPFAAALAAHLAATAPAAPGRALDLAAGSGIWGIALAEAMPGLAVAAQDWPAVLDTTRRVVARQGLSDRFSFIGGDLLAVPFGTGYRFATLGHILHSEGEARSRRLLRKVFEALAPGGTVAIAEFLVAPDRSGPLPGLMFAVNMLVHTEAGNAYAAAEINGWLAEAGFVRARTLEFPGPVAVILADRP
jgi:SAM-dependent methyltransferase